MRFSSESYWADFKAESSRQIPADSTMIVLRETNLVVLIPALGMTLENAGSADLITFIPCALKVVLVAPFADNSVYEARSLNRPPRDACRVRG